MKMSSCVALCAVLSVLVAPACEIKIGSGAGGETPADPAGGTTGAGAGGNFTPDEQAAIDAIENTDNQLAVAKADLTAQFASYTLQGLVEMNAGDPATLDEATLQQLVDQYAPTAAAQALQWVQTVDPSTIDLGLVFRHFQWQFTRLLRRCIPDPRGRADRRTPAATARCSAQE